MLQIFNTCGISHQSPFRKKVFFISERQECSLKTANATVNKRRLAIITLTGSLSTKSRKGTSHHQGTWLYPECFINKLKLALLQMIPEKMMLSEYSQMSRTPRGVKVWMRVKTAKVQHVGERDWKKNWEEVQRIIFIKWDIVQSGDTWIRVDEGMQ